MRFINAFLSLALASSAAALVPRGGCKMQLVSPAHAGSTCGQQGYYQQPTPCGTSKESCMENCRAKCWGNSACLSYSYDSSSKKCTQYKKKASAQGYRRKQGSVAVWDRCCWENHCPSCLPYKTLCGDKCANLKNDKDNCGGCGNACPSGSSCEHGACVCSVVEQKICGGECTDTQTDDKNCGSCGTDCTTGVENTCSGGVCQCPSPNTGVCSGQCVDTQTDNQNCGYCGHDCTTGPQNTCSDGICQCPFPTLGFCAGRCVNTFTDSQNCGDCGNVCLDGDSSAYCSIGICFCEYVGFDYCPGVGCVAGGCVD